MRNEALPAAATEDFTYNAFLHIRKEPKAAAFQASCVHPTRHSGV